MLEPEISIVVSPRDWAEQLHRFVADHGGALVRARVLDAREALEDSYTVLVAEDLTSFLTPRLVDELHRRDRRVLGVYDPDEPWGRDRLAELGVDETAPLTTPAEDLVRIIAALASTAQLDRELSALVDDSRPRLKASPELEAETDTPLAVVTAVGGPSGGVGGTEVAIGLAAELGRRDHRCVLVDGDEVAPSIAQRLGLPLHPNLRTAIDVVEHRSGGLLDTLTDLAGAGTQVLCGLPNPRDWPEVRPGELLAVVEELSIRFEHLVINTSHAIEDLSGLGNPPRFGLTRALLACADQIVAVGAPTPVGLTRLLDWIADLRALAPRTPLHVALNKAPDDGFKRRELNHEICRTVPVSAVHFLPSDEKVEQAAWDGTLPASGGFTRSLLGLADSVAPSLSASRRARRLSLGGVIRMRRSKA
ncbi:MAG: CpaE family protein [Nitriliruptorales bacterium]